MALPESTLRARKKRHTDVPLPHQAYLFKPLLTTRAGLAIIQKSVARVAKKAAPGQEEAYVKRVLANIITTTDP